MTPIDSESFTQSISLAKEYADSIVKPPLEQLGGILADTVGLWRLKNRVRVLLKAKAYCEQKGIKTDKLLPSVFVPLIEEAGNTDDDTLSDMFARLLASHVDAINSHRVHPSFSKILAQLSPLDAQVLLAVDEFTGCGRVYRHIQIIDVVNVVQGRVKIHLFGNEVSFSLDNLSRLGLCADDSPGGWHVKSYGRTFLAACGIFPPLRENEG